MCRLKWIGAVFFLIIAVNGAISGENNIIFRFRSAQENTSLLENIRYFTFTFNGQGQMTEYRIEDQLENEPKNLRRLARFQILRDYTLYTRKDYSQGEVTKDEQRIIYSASNGYEVIRSGDPEGTPDLFYRRTGDRSFTQIFKEMEIYSIDFSRNSFAVHNIYHDRPSAYFHYQNEKLERVMYGEKLFAQINYEEDHIHIRSPSLEMGDSNMYVYIGDDYVPPADNMIRAFNAFLMPGEYRGYLLPFLVGYF